MWIDPELTRVGHGSTFRCVIQIEDGSANSVEAAISTSEGCVHTMRASTVHLGLRLLVCVHNSRLAAFLTAVLSKWGTQVEMCSPEQLMQMEVLPTGVQALLIEPAGDNAKTEEMLLRLAKLAKAGGGHAVASSNSCSSSSTGSSSSSSDSSPLPTLCTLLPVVLVVEHHGAVCLPESLGADSGLLVSAVQTPVKQAQLLAALIKVQQCITDASPARDESQAASGEQESTQAQTMLSPTLSQSSGSPVLVRSALSLSSSPPPVNEFDCHSTPLMILVAEDNPINSKVVVRMLSLLKHQVDVAWDGAEAVAAVAVKQFDLILMDMQMPVSEQPANSVPAVLRGVCCWF